MLNLPLWGWFDPPCPAESWGGHEALGVETKASEGKTFLWRHRASARASRCGRLRLEKSSSVGVSPEEALADHPGLWGRRGGGIAVH